MTQEKNIQSFTSAAKLLPREEKYSAIEKERLAIKLACQSFQSVSFGKAF